MERQRSSSAVAVVQTKFGELVCLSHKVVIKPWQMSEDMDRVLSAAEGAGPLSLDRHPSSAADDFWCSLEFGVAAIGDSLCFA